MSNTGSSHPDNRDETNGQKSEQREPGLEELMARIRLELTGDARDVLNARQCASEVADAGAEQAGKTSSTCGKELSLDEVMARVRLELQRRRSGSTDGSGAASTAVTAGGVMPRWRPSASPLAPQPTYVLADLLRFADADFVEHVFRILLRRPASAEERAHYLGALRSGGVGKVEILGDIRFSKEGMQHCVHVDGLLLPYKLHKWRRVPVFGWFLAMAIAIFRLPRLFAHLQKLEAGTAQESQQVGLALNDLAGAVDQQLRHIQVGIDSCAGREEVRALTVASHRLGDLVGTHGSKLAQIAQANHETRAAVDLVERRLSEEIRANATASDRLRERLEAQASVLVKGELADQQTRAVLGLIESKLVEQSSAYAKLEARLPDEVQALTTALSRLQDQLETQDSKLAQFAVIHQEARDIVGAVEARLAEQVDAQARLEHRIQTHVSDEVNTLLLATGPLRERLTDATSALAQIELAGGVMQQAIGAMEARLDKSAQFEAELKARLESGLADRAAAHAQLEQRVQTQSPLVAKVAADNAGHGRAVRDIERRLMAFFDHMSRQATDSHLSDTGSSQVDTGLLDAHYVSFEDTFRGTREDIKTRAAHYLETFSDAGIGKEKGLVLDLGCGRGEWLEVLTENGYTSRGVDLNSVMVSEALALGLDAVESDAIAYLRTLNNASVSAVTSMHLVEHIPYEILITLLDEAARVLQPGGVLILETPNPENLTVGSYWFYMDPTHRNPIPPALLQWVVQARGFENAAIERLTQNRAVFDIQPVDEDVAGSSQINKVVGLLTAAPDYAIVARKQDPSVTLPRES